MKQLVFLLVFFSGFIASGQEVGSSLLPNDKVSSVVTQGLKQKFWIYFPVYKAYQYWDRSGKYLLVLTERSYKPSEKPMNDSILAFCINQDQHELVWKARDFIAEKNGVDTEESSIWFWTKYLTLEDIDADGLIEPIVVYGTSAMNGTDDGRLKFLVYYKGKKYAIRHQNSVYDGGRKTQIDKAFYSLPAPIQKKVKGIMKMISDKGQSIFPNNWNEEMKKQSTLFSDQY